MQSTSAASSIVPNVCNQNTNSTLVSGTDKKSCPHCGKLYKSVKIHISKSHPNEYRASLVVPTEDAATTHTNQDPHINESSRNNNSTFL